MQMKATKLAAILSRLRLAPLALFAVLGLALASPQTAQAGNYYKFTFLRVKANPTGSGIAGKQLAISELALYDASMNRINLNLTKYTSSTPVGIGVNQFNISHAEMQNNDGALFNDCSSHGEEKWFVTQDIASVKPYVVMRLADNAEPAAFYNLASADGAVSYDNRLPKEWIVEYSTDCSSWQELDHRNLDDSQLPTSDRTWYAGAGAQVANTAPKTCFLIQSQYTQVEYINSETFDPGKGPALRIFGFHLQADDYVETKVLFNDMPTDSGGANIHTIFCNRQGANAANSFASFVNTSKLRFDYGRPAADSDYSAAALLKDVEYVIKGDGVSDKKLTATSGGTTVVEAKETGTSIGAILTSDLLLFAHSAYSGSGTNWDAPQTSDTSSMARMKMYYFKVYDAKGSSSLRLDLIPVTVGSQVGMYDQVSGTFYKSVTGTEFTAGTSFLGRLVLDPRNVAADADPNASGGDIILKEGNDYIHIFTTPGTSTFTVKPNVSATATALLVGGGGGGGNNCGGGGGGGGVTAVSTPTPLTSGDYSVTVGAGGAAALNNTVQGTAGGASSIGTLVSAPGGNGGYGFSCGSNSYEGGTAGTGGGKGGDSHGSGQIGSNGSDGSSPYNILGFSQAQVFGGGGGGGAYAANYGNSSGGAGGGGKGSGSKDNLYATAGENGLGGGGGGGAGGFDNNQAYVPGGAGGSGIVIIRVSSGSPVGPTPVSGLTVEFSAASYTGSTIDPTITIKNGSTTVASGTASEINSGSYDLTVAWPSEATIKNAGDYTLTVTGGGTTYTGSKTATFTVAKFLLNPSPTATPTTYDGKTQDCPDQTVSGKSLKGLCTMNNGQRMPCGTQTVSFTLKDTANYTFPNNATVFYVSWTVNKGNNSWTQIPAISTPTWSIYGGQGTLTPGKVKWGTLTPQGFAQEAVAPATWTKDGVSQGTFSGTLPTGKGVYTITYTCPTSKSLQSGLADCWNLPSPDSYTISFEIVDRLNDITPPHFSSARTFKYDGATKSVTLAGFDEITMTKESSSVESAAVAGIYKVYVTPKIGNCWSDTKSTATRALEWGIVPSDYTEPFDSADRNFLKTLVNHPNRVSGGALPTGITGGDIVLRFPNRENGVTVSHDYVHIFTNSTASFNNETGVARPGRALIVGGGGGGGKTKQRRETWTYDGVGGGGGGGGVRVLSDMMWNGEFSVTVGKGGTSDSNGSPSSIVGGGASYEVLGGGHGGYGSNVKDDSGINATDGGSGGGGGTYANHANQSGANLDSAAGSGGAGSLWGYPGCAGVADVKDTRGYGGGGGGAGVGATGRNGAMGAASTVIDGCILCFGGGGGGGHSSVNSQDAMSYGGLGGGGGSKTHSDKLDYCYAGVDGLGGGGAGYPGVCNGAAGSGRPGGSGLVAIRYTDDTRLNQIKTVAVPRELLYDRPYNFNTYATGLVDTDDYTVEGQLEARDIGTYTVTLKLKYPDDSEWDDGTDQPQVLTWRIVPEGPISSDFYLKLCSNSNRVERDILQMGAPIVFRWKETDAVSGQEYNHYVNIFTDCVNNVQFELKEDLPNADILLVGGGGGGGAGASSKYAGGGGGAGGYRLESTTLVSGNYSIAVGRGGLAGNAGGTSSVGGAVGFSTLSVGGGAKGGSAQNAGGSADAQIGGSGGGAGGNSTAVGTAGPYGRNGGSGHTTGGGGGGGGAGAEGKSPTSASDTGNKGGDGLSNSILGYVEWFAGGGAGGEGPDSPGHVTYGGKGGGGNSVNRKKEAPMSTPGVNGQGGGGAGASDGNGGPPPNPTRGGDGIVIIAYTALSGSVVAKPQMNTTVCRYDGHEFDAREFLDSKLNLEFSGIYTATDVGTYTFEVTPAAGYHWLGTEDEDEDARDPIVFSWTIEPRVLADFAAFGVIGIQMYSGQHITPAVTLTDATWSGGTGRPLVSGSDYTLEYFNNMNIGTATVRATGKGNYTGAMSTTFQIVANPNEDSYYVTPEAGDDGAGTGWDAPTSLKTAFDQASAKTASSRPCTIYVKAGTYAVPENPWRLGTKIKTVSVLGGYSGIGLARGADRTVLDGCGSRSLLSFVLQSGSDNYERNVRFNQVDFANAVDAIVGSADDWMGWSEIIFESCRFSGNKTETPGRGAILTVGSLQIMPRFFQCEVRGNYATIAGSYVIDGGDRGRDYFGTAFVGNSGVSAPLFRFCSSNNNPLEIQGCTFAYNAISNTPAANSAAVVYGDRIWETDKTKIANTICACNFAGSQSSGVAVMGWSGGVTYNHVLLGVGDSRLARDGDIGLDTIKNGDPLFAAGTLTPTFGSAGVATWKNAAGKTVDPVDIDVHLKSVMGRWNGSAWVNDSVTSPAIDAGDPASDYASEPAPNGGRVNLGVYGNTAEASKANEAPGAAATLSGATGFSEIKQLDNGHTVLIYSNVTDAASFTVAEGGIARILVVGGGGKGGGYENVYGYGAGGGGAGGVVENGAMMLTAGTYGVVVGGSQYDSVLKDSTGTTLITAVHGGNGSNANSGIAGSAGGSGGGYGGHASIAKSGGEGTSGQGCAGGGDVTSYAGSGGGGYSSSGGAVANTGNGASGGNGYVSDITGEMCGYACGGGGGAGCASSKWGVAGNGGFVTIGGQQVRLGGNGGADSTGISGAAGTGSGGGGGSGYGGGGAGGSGIVVVHLYTKWDIGVVTFDANGGTGGPTPLALNPGDTLPDLDPTSLPARTGYTFGGYARKWWEARLMTGNASDICNEGTTVFAQMGDARGGTINNVEFTGGLGDGGSIPDKIEFGTGWGYTTYYIGEEFHDTTISDSYKNILSAGMWQDGISTVKITLKGLTMGRHYLFQFFIHDGRITTGSANTGARTVSVDEVDWYRFGQYGKNGVLDDSASKYGATFIYRFVASGESEELEVYFKGEDWAPLGAQFNAVQLRELSSAEDLIYYDKDGHATKSTWDVDGDATLSALWNRGTMYKLGVDDGNQSSWSKSYSGSVGWAASRDGSVDASHQVSSMYDYVVVSGCRLRTLTSHASDPNTPLEFGGHSLCLEGPLALKLGNNQDQNALEYLRIDRLIGAGGSIELSSYCKTTLTGESITIQDDSALKIYVDANKARHLYVKPPISGAGDLILWLGNSTSTSDRYNTILTLEGDNSGFTGAIKTIQPDDWNGLNPSQYDFYVMNNFGGTVESLPDLASCGVTNYVHFKYDGLVGGQGLRISTNEFSSVIKERIVLYSDETDFDAPNLPLMTFPEGTEVDPAEFTVRHAAGTNGTGTAFIRLKTITNGDGTITLVANGDMSSEPAHFQRVESIYSTGSQYLNTGYCPNAKTWMEADLFFVGDANPANDATASIFGTLGTNDTNMTDVRNTSTTYAGHFGGDKSNKNFIYESGAGSKSGAVIGTPFSNMWIVIEKTSATVAGVTLAGTSCNHAGTAAFPLYLFGCNAGGTGYAFSKFPQMSVRSWKIYESDTGTKGGANERLVRDFVPVIDTFENNRPGLYDRVEGKFYPSETGVDFLAGEPTEPAAYFGGKAKASILDAEGYSQVLQVANDHTVLVFANTNAPGSFTVSEGGVARVLVIGGGGAGGDGGTSSAGGGGGAGAMIEEYDLLLTAGASYTVEVGAGGAGANTDGLSGNDGKDSILSCGDERVVVAQGGGGGGGLSNSPGHDGGSGGGSSCVLYAEDSKSGSALNPLYGNDGGKSSGWWMVGGGGGAGSPGQAAQSLYAIGKGGAGLANDITGSWVTYAAGGEGWGGERSGLDGTGSGGNGSTKSCAGGSGVVIVHLYTKWSVATVTLDHNDGTGETDSVFVKAGAPMPTLITIPERHSYAFAGYFDAVTGGTQYYTAAGESAHVWDKDGDATLYAHWDPVKYHVINKTSGPEIVVNPEWLESAFGSEKTTEQYQDELFTTNASGVVAWQAYILGFDGDQVATAKIAEETAQNADPATVTIRLANMPPLREGTGCTVKYSLYAATSTEDLMNDRGTVVTNDTDTTNVKVYEKWHESTFEAPLDDLTENEPVRYYRIKVHFTFGGGK